MTKTPTLSPDDWAYFEDQGFIAVPCWGGCILLKPRHIGDAKVDTLIALLNGDAG